MRRQTNEYSPTIDHTCSMVIGGRKAILHISGNKQNYAFTLDEPQMERLEKFVSAYREKYPRGKPLVEVLK